MAKARVVKSAEAVALAEHVRWVAAIWEGRTGFSCRPRHEKREIVVGHAAYRTDPEVAANVDTLIAALETLGSAAALGYTIAPLHLEEETAAPAAVRVSPSPAPVAALSQ